MKHICILLCLVSPFLGRTQAADPGGVEGAVRWFSTEEKYNGHFEWVNKLPGEVPFADEAGLHMPFRNRPLNFNPALYLNGDDDGLLFPAPAGNLSQLHIFTVYQPEDTAAEKSIWCLESDTASRMILTTSRMADLEAFQYMNFDFKQQGRAEVSAYFQNGVEAEKSQDPPAKQFIRVGAIPGDRNLPIRPFKGVIPEMIVFNRFLTDEEILRIESYLALKYGITLQSIGPVSYLNAHGQTIWNGADNAVYHHRVAGIGRDDASGLTQLKSTAATQPGLPTIGRAEGAELPDNNFLVWGDNNALLDWAPKTAGRPQKLMRDWLIRSSGSASPITTSLAFNTTEVLTTPESGNTTWWLIADRSGTGDFPLASLDFYPMDRYGAEGPAIFDSVIWDPDGSGSDVFSLASGPALLPVFEVAEPVCNPAAPGELHLSVQGGRMPYAIRFTGNGTTQTATIQDHAVHPFTGIQPGEYRLHVEDADHRRFEETVYIQSLDAPVSSLAGQYEIPADGTLNLNAAAAAATNDIRYAWTGPDGFRQSGPVAAITAPGQYELSMEKDGCPARQSITVKAPGQSNLTGAEAFPNPTGSGVFQVRVSLGRPAAAEMSVYNALGDLVLTQRQSGNDHYLFRGKLTAKGVYLIKIQSEQSSRTIRLIVN
ncbi:MAG: T9SS type A sorting domain-containing protein [Lewinellaceae bacterium]|nr:T9SS type A sorting domain-containing protein [Lewinellaceae bacterium]